MVTTSNPLHVSSLFIHSEDSELILKDVFSFCKLIAFLAARYECCYGDDCSVNYTRVFLSVCTHRRWNQGGTGGTCPTKFISAHRSLVSQ